MINIRRVYIQERTNWKAEKGKKWKGDRERKRKRVCQRYANNKSIVCVNGASTTLELRMEVEYLKYIKKGDRSH